MKKFGLVVFDSTHSAIAAETLAKGSGLSCRLIGTPGPIVAGCGLSLRFELEELQILKDLLSDKNIPYKGIYKGKRRNLQAEYIKIDWR